jgi:hypothetical protein
VSLIEQHRQDLGVSSLCEALEVPRASFYRQRSPRTPAVPVALVSALLGRFENEEAGEKAEVETEKIESIKETAGKLCRFGLSIGNDVVRKATGIDFIKGGEYANARGMSLRQEPPTRVLSSIVRSKGCSRN